MQDGAQIGLLPGAMPEELLELLAATRDDPLGFALMAWPWGKTGTVLEKFSGPLAWQREIMEDIRLGLIDLNQAIQLATASGHGVGKSALVSMLVIWAFTTSPDCRGVVTANTETQLKTKTWAELGRWFNLCWFARDFFVLNATSLVSKDPLRSLTWRIDMIPWSEKNTEAFQGLHNKGKRLLLIFDEASAIHDLVWEAAEGALTDADTQIIWLVFGNPTRNTGRFKECFDGGKHHEMWRCRQIDSRSVPITNKKRFESWIRIYGEDSDFVRIRVLGKFPRQGLMEFFLASDIDGAMSNDREVFVDAFTPLAIGVDVARYGANNSVIFPRKGRDARAIPRKVFNGISTVELSNHVFDCWQQWRPDGIFIDGGGVGGGVVDQCRAKQLFVMEVQFGGKDDITGLLGMNTSGHKYANKRAAMYGALREWLASGIIPKDDDLRTALLAIRYTFNKQDQIQLISKEDLLDENPGLSLDDVDALALTFGGPLAPSRMAGGDPPAVASTVEWDYNPYDLIREEIAA